MQDKTQRPSAVAEFRAWLGVGAALVVNMVGGVWWAANMTAKMDYMQEAISEMRARSALGYTGAEAARDFTNMQKQINDHEARLRQLERRPGS